LVTTIIVWSEAKGEKAEPHASALSKGPLAGKGRGKAGLSPLPGLALRTLGRTEARYISRPEASASGSQWVRTR
jgi:hypothetical protein